MRRRWQSLNSLPGVKWLFSRIIGWYIPYTGSIGALVWQLEPGHAIVRLRDRRKVRNHLNSIHAIALANLGELTTGLAALSGMPANARGILAGLEIEYVKKARGNLEATCQCSIPATAERLEYRVEAVIKDAEDEVVATVRARWLIGPVQIADKNSR